MALQEGKQVPAWHRGFPHSGCGLGLSQKSSASGFPLVLSLGTTRAQSTPLWEGHYSLGPQLKSSELPPTAWPGRGRSQCHGGRGFTIQRGPGAGLPLGMGREEGTGCCHGCSRGPCTPLQAYLGFQPGPCVTRTHFSLQVQHVYPAQVQYVEGGDAVYANGAMYVWSAWALVPHRLTVPLHPMGLVWKRLSSPQSFSPTPNPQGPSSGPRLLCSWRLENSIQISNQAIGP